MIRSLLGVVDVARDATLAVGAYVGILREHVKAEWATVLGGSFDERVATARARMETRADALNEYEAENDGLDGEAAPDDLWAAEGRAQGKLFAAAVGERNGPTLFCCDSSPIGYLCTEPRGHAGEHKAKGIPGTWPPNSSPAAGGEQSAVPSVSGRFWCGASDSQSSSDAAAAGGPASVAACQRTEEARSGETPRPAPGLSNPECPYCHHRLPRALFTTQK